MRRAVGRSTLALATPARGEGVNVARDVRGGAKARSTVLRSARLITLDSLRPGRSCRARVERGGVYQSSPLRSNLSSSASHQGQ